MDRFNPSKAQLNRARNYPSYIKGESCTAGLVGKAVVDYIMCLSTDPWNTMMVVWVSKVRIPLWGTHAAMDTQKEPSDDVLHAALGGDC